MQQEEEIKKILNINDNDYQYHKIKGVNKYGVLNM
jgi:hypothetical protein